MTDDKTKDLARRRRDELTATRLERDLLAARIVEREIALVEDRTQLRQLDDRAGFLLGWLEARKLP